MTKTIPWPNLGENPESTTVVPLRENYSVHAMWYLDTLEARPIFETQADIIIKNGSRGIIDVGCRCGPVVNILHEKGYSDFEYMGFDTSEEPIELATEQWKDHRGIEFRHGSWNDHGIFDVDFDVDLVIWSGVLVYRPDDHFDFFKRVSKYLLNSDRAIVQEPLWNQRHWDDRLVLHCITDQFDNYRKFATSIEEHIVDCDIFAGRRLIMDIEL